MKIEMITPKSDQQQGSASRRAALHPNPPTSTRERGAGMLPLPLAMKYSTQVKPLSYLKANAAEVIRQLTEQREPMVITQNGEARLVIQDVVSYQQAQETLALLKLLALGQREIDAGLATPAAAAGRQLRARNAQRQTAKE